MGETFCLWASDRLRLPDRTERRNKIFSSLFEFLGDARNPKIGEENFIEA